MGCWLGESEYNCQTCGGNLTYYCDCCRAEVDCPECEGTGWEPSLVDIEAFQEAERALTQKMIAAGCGALTHEWIEGDLRLGRTGDEYGRVAVADFLRPVPA